MTTPGPQTPPVDPERGSVTAEFALGLPGVVATILLALGALVAGGTYISCIEAARVGAREVMLSGSTSHAEQAAMQSAGSQAHVSTDISRGWGTVRVQRPLFVSGFPITVSASMSAPIEGQG